MSEVPLYCIVCRPPAAPAPGEGEREKQTERQRDRETETQRGGETERALEKISKEGERERKQTTLAMPRALRGIRECHTGID